MIRPLMLCLSVGGFAVAACAPMENGGGAAPTPPVEAPGECKADVYRSYIGRNRTELPAAPAGETWRVTCSTCPVTMDFNPNRLNIVYDDATGVISDVKCG